MTRLSPAADPASPGGPAVSGEALPEPAAAQPLPKSPRATLPYHRHQREADPAAAPAQTDTRVEDLRTWARTFDGTRPPPPFEAPRPQISRENRKFFRVDPETEKGEVPRPANTLEEGEEADAPPPSRSSPGDNLAVACRVEAWSSPPARSLLRTESRRSKPARRPFLLSLGGQVLVLVLAGVSFLAGRASSPPSTQPAVPVSPAGPAGPTGAAAGVLDEAIAAETAGDFRQAAGLLRQLAFSGVRISGLDYRMAVLAVAQGDVPGALGAINRSIAAGQRVSECYCLRGAIAQRQGKLESSVHYFQAAAQADPFDAHAFFGWAEALRRFGKPEEALLHLRQASDRATTADDRLECQLAMRSTLIEAGRAPEFAAEQAAQLALPRPPGDWLLTAAVVALEEQNFGAAAAYLTRARPALSPELFAAALQDPLFLAYRDQPLLGAFYPPPPQSRRALFDAQKFVGSTVAQSPAP